MERNLIKIERRRVRVCNSEPEIRVYKSGTTDLNIAARELLKSDDWGDIDVFFDKDRPSEFYIKMGGGKERKVKGRFGVGVGIYERLRVVAGQAEGKPLCIGIHKRPLNNTYWKLVFKGS